MNYCTSTGRRVADTRCSTAGAMQGHFADPLFSLAAMQRRTLLKRALAGSAALALPAFAQARSLLIGQSVALTGPAAQLGIQMNAGAKLWIDQINANGGINGQTLELRVADDGYEPDRCKANTEKFIKDDAFALLGYVGTPTCAAALPLINEEKIPFFGPFTGAEILREPFSKSIFHLRASYYDETELIVKQLTSLGLNRIAVFYQNDAYGKAGLEGTVRALKRRNLEARGHQHRRAQHGGRGQGRGRDRAEERQRGRADQRLQVVRGLHPRSAQGRLRRHLLQRLVRRHAGPGRRAEERRRRRDDQPGDAVSVHRVGADHPRVPGRRGQGRRHGADQLLEPRRLSGGQGLHRRPEARAEERDARAADRRARIDSARRLRRLHGRLRLA